jgi:hypothetical protein
VLAGWLDEDACRTLGLDLDAARACRERVRHRQPQDRPLDVALAPEALGDLSTALGEVDPSFRSGQRKVVVVDLACVVATQPVVALDDQRALAITADTTLEQLSATTLPISPAVLPVSAFDERSQAWVVRSRGASIAVSGRYVAAGESGDPGTQCFGFLVTAQPSRVTIGVLEGRAVLLDGHHRAMALLAQGVRKAPVALDHDTTITLTTEHLARDVIFGSAPPVLADYLDDDVSLAATVARVERVIMITASEVDLPD